MRRCDKTSVDQAKHISPFTSYKPPYIYEDESENSSL
jgi:hypothetical protein